MKFINEIVPIVVIFSDSTPRTLKEHIRTNHIRYASIASNALSSVVTFQILIHDIQDYRIVEEILQKKQAPVVFDMTFDIQIGFYIAEMSNKYKTLSFSFNREFQINNEWSLHAHPSWHMESEALLTVLRYTEWDVYSLISSSETWSQTISDNINSQIPAQTRVYVQSFDSYENILTIIARKIKSRGTRINIITSDGKSAKNALLGFQEKQIAGEGYGFLLSQMSSWFELDSTQPILDDGLLYVSEVGTEQAQSSEEFEGLKLATLLTDIGYALYQAGISQNSVTVVSSYTVRYYLKEKYNLDQHDAFNVVNVVDGKRTIIAEIRDGSINFLTENGPWFPGKTQAFPQNIQAIIPISMNRDIKNPDPAPPFEGAEPQYKGADLAMPAVNNRHDILPNHILERFDYSAGASYFVHDYAYAEIEQVQDSLGYATLASGSSGMTMGLMEVFDEFGIVIPMVGAGTTGISLSDSGLWPNFSRVILSDLWLSAVYVQMFEKQGWTKCAILYADEAWGRGVYENFVEEAENFGITVINDEDKRALPSDISENTISKHYYKYQHIIDIGARIILIIILSPGPKLSIEAFYDLGVRRGDMVFMGIEWLSAGLATSPPEETVHKRQELLLGAIQFFPAETVGTFGDDVNEEYVKAYGFDVSQFGCYYYDAILAVAYTFDWMVSTGKDYEEPDQFRLNFFDQRFTGCTGTVTYQQGTNDRSPINYDIQNMQLIDNVWVLKTVGQYSPTSAQLFTYDEPIIWSDGSTDVPADTISVDYDCPFPDGEEETFVLGRVVVFGICFLIAAVSIGISVYIWRKWWRIQPEKLREKYEISFNDLLIMLIIIIDFFQLTSMGPDFSSLSSFLQTVGDASRIDLSQFITMREGIFYLFLDFVIGLWFVWMLLCLMIIHKIDIRFQRFVIWRSLGQIAENVLPFLGNAAFLPIISIILDVYVCDQAHGDSPLQFSDTFLARDCHQTCWEGDHLTYAIVGFLGLVLYLPLAVYTRPMWQEFQAGLHIKAAPLYLLVKSITQIVFITLQKTVYRASKSGHAIIYLVVMALYVVFNYKVQTFNYDRVWHWNFMSLLGVIWIAILAVLDSATAEHLVYVGLLFAGWIAIFVYGYIYMYKQLPSYLYSRSEVDIKAIFKFAYRPSIHPAPIKIQHRLSKVEEIGFPIVPQEMIQQHLREQEIKQATNSVDTSTMLDVPKPPHGTPRESIRLPQSDRFTQDRSNIEQDTTITGWGHDVYNEPESSFYDPYSPAAPSDSSFSSSYGSA